jgi:hypothetical protein
VQDLVVMFADLLTRALGKGEEEGRSSDLLLADLVHSRARLHATSGETPVAQALARELTYDGALIRLCTSGLGGTFNRPGRLLQPV